MPDKSHLPSRIVSLQPSVTVALDRLGALQRLVACTKYCADVCPQVADGHRAIVADSWSAHAKEILAARPDLVIAAVPYQLEAVAEILKAGVRFLALAPHSLRDVYADIAMLAGLVGACRLGVEIVDAMQREILAVQEKTRTSNSLRVFSEEWGKPIIASQRWVGELIEACGGQLIAEPGKQVLAGEILRADPDVIVAAWCGAGDRVPLRKIVRSRGWEATRAARQGRVFCIRDEFLNTPATTLIQGLHALAWALHPELFQRPEGIRAISEERDV